MSTTSIDNDDETPAEHKDQCKDHSHAGDQPCWPAPAWCVKEHPHVGPCSRGAFSMKQLRFGK